MSDEPLVDSRRYCHGGPAVFVNTELHIAQCPGGCDIWFDTMMDEPVFPPHTVTIATTVTFGPESRSDPTMADEPLIDSRPRCPDYFDGPPDGDPDRTHTCDRERGHHGPHHCPLCGTAWDG